MVVGFYVTNRPKKGFLRASVMFNLCVMSSSGLSYFTPEPPVLSRNVNTRYSVSRRQHWSLHSILHIDRAIAGFAHQLVLSHSQPWRQISKHQLHQLHSAYDRHYNGR